MSTDSSRPGATATSGMAALAGILACGLVGCGGEPAAPPEQPKAQPEAPADTPKPPPKAERPEGPLPALLMSQAHFAKKAGKPVPGPAKLVIWRTDGKNWWKEVILDETSNVFHKAVAWRGGILTIAAGQLDEEDPKGKPSKPGLLRHWKPEGGEWKPTTLWEVSWEGARFNRLRDIEFGDLDGDGSEDMAIATHDMGVVAVGTEKDGKWTFTQMDQEADRFVHEIEIGDVDGDGKLEFYATPSDRNKASGESQPGEVVRYDFKGGKFVRSKVVGWEVSHAKEILVHDVNGDGKDELYVVREGHVVKGKGKKARTQLKDPVKILRMDPDGKGGWTEHEVAEIKDHQMRFLVPGDVTHDGKTELVAAGYKSGLYVLVLKEDGTFERKRIGPESSGFEHATHVADLDGDGKVEIYVAADDQRELRKHSWNGSGFDTEVIAKIPDMHITWNIQDGKL